MDVQLQDEPFDPMTRLAAEMLVPAEQTDNVKAIVFLENPDVAGIAMSGYDDPNDAVVALIIHLKAIFASQGRQLDFVTLDDDGVNKV